MGKPGGSVVKRKIFVWVLAAMFAWTICDVSDACAYFEDMPSDEEVIAVGALVAMVLTAIVVISVKSWDDGKPGEEYKHDLSLSESDSASEASLHIDPVLTLEKDGVGAGLSFTF